MTDSSMKILELFARTIPKLTDAEKEKLLSFGEGMAILADKRPTARDIGKPA